MIDQSNAEDIGKHYTSISSCSSHGCWAIEEVGVLVGVDAVR